MTAPYQVLPAADRDLDEQAHDLAREVSPETAWRFYDAAASTFEDLARVPGIGEPWKSSQPHLAGVRVFRLKGFEKHLVFYRPVGAVIEIIRVLHGARDLDRALSDDPSL